MARGGYRQPADPAPVSGPGSLSERTDGGPADSQPTRRMPNADYGESADFQQQQQGAPMAQAQATGQQAEPQPVDTSGIVALEAPDDNPRQSIMDGAVAGAGAPRQVEQFDRNRMRTWLPVLKLVASRRNASPATRQLVRQLQAQMGS